MTFYTGRDLVGEKGGFVGAVCGGVASATQGFHVGHGHAQDGQFVRLAGQGAAGGHHVRQLRDVGRHLVPPPALDLAVVLPARGGGGEKEEGDVKQGWERLLRRVLLARV